MVLPSCRSGVVAEPDIGERKRQQPEQDRDPDDVLHGCSSHRKFADPIARSAARVPTRERSVPTSEHVRDLLARPALVIETEEADFAYVRRRGHVREISGVSAVSGRASAMPRQDRSRSAQRPCGGEEAMVVTFRRHTLLPLEDGLDAHGPAAGRTDGPGHQGRHRQADHRGSHEELRQHLRFLIGESGLWWAVRGSNSRPARCKRAALPLS